MARRRLCSHTLGTWLLAGAVVVLANKAVAAEKAFELGTAGWSLEQFGSDVAILRSVAHAAADGAGLLLACSAQDRRIRLLLPSGVASEHPDGGKALIVVAAPPHARKALVVHFQMADGSLIVATTAARTDDAVDGLARLLVGPSSSIDLLVSWGNGPVVLTHLDVLRLILKGGAPARDVVDRFLIACQQSDARQAH